MPAEHDSRDDSRYDSRDSYDSRDDSRYDSAPPPRRRSDADTATVVSYIGLAANLLTLLVTAYLLLFVTCNNGQSGSFLVVLFAGALLFCVGVSGLVFNGLAVAYGLAGRKSPDARQRRRAVDAIQIASIGQVLVVVFGVVTSVVCFNALKPPAPPPPAAVPPTPGQ